MNYISTVQASEKWGISIRRIAILCKEGRIPGVKQIGSRWMIPEKAEKPSDNRTREAKKTTDNKSRELNNTEQEDPLFRYPHFEKADVSSVVPPLSKDELIYTKAMEAFFACRFEEAGKLLPDFPDKIQNKYLRIFALRGACMICIFNNCGNLFLHYYEQLTTEIEGCTKYRTELSELLFEIKASLGDSTYYSDDFKIRHDYNYHDSFFPHLGSLCCIALFFSNGKGIASTLRAYEFICASYDGKENYNDSLTMHLYLGCTYAVRGIADGARTHLMKAFSIAEEHELYYSVAMLYYYMEKVFSPILLEFSEEFQDKIRALSENIHKRYVKFMDSMSKNSIFKLLLHNEYLYVLYAVKGYKSKEVAEILSLSERTVRNKYSEIYDLVGVSNKRELVELYQQSI